MAALPTDAATDESIDAATSGAADRPTTAPKLMSVEEALRSIAQPTPISVIAPVRHAVGDVTRRIRRTVPRVLPGVLTHCVAIILGCAMGWQLHVDEAAELSSLNDPLANFASPDLPLAHWRDDGAASAAPDVERRATASPAVDSPQDASRPRESGELATTVQAPVAVHPLETLFLPPPEHHDELMAAPRVADDPTNPSPIAVNETSTVESSPIAELSPLAEPSNLAERPAAASLQAAYSHVESAAAGSEFGGAVPVAATPRLLAPLNEFAAPMVGSAGPSETKTAAVSSVPATTDEIAAPTAKTPIPDAIEVPNDAVALDASPSTSPGAASRKVVATAPHRGLTGKADDVAEFATIADTDVVESGVVVVGAATYTPEDLRQVLAEAHKAVGCPRCQSTGVEVVTEWEESPGRARLASHQSGQRTETCPACNGLPTARFTLAGYEALCRLAEVATFVRVEAGDTETWAVRKQCCELLGAAVAQRDRLNKAGRLAGSRLDDPARTHNGVLLAGTVERVSYLGSLYHSQVVLFGVPRRVTVVSEREPPFQVGQRVVVLGAVVDRPVENLRGYQGDVQQVVWGGLPLVLAD
ncbi:MAG: hypothetical protein KDA63_21115 [Planctomycetales bacterium]|nr:hypothetical protein [Planctomycetales bacterium]